MVRYIQMLEKKKKKNLPPIILYLEKLLFRIEVEIEFSKQTKSESSSPLDQPYMKR